MWGGCFLLFVGVFVVVLFVVLFFGSLFIMALSALKGELQAA